jgi:predicted CXXCH cytochrome family protein
MLNSRRLGWRAALHAVVFVLGCSGADGLPGKDGLPGTPGTPGTPGQDGDAGVVPSLKNDVSGTVTDGTSPLKDVAVTAQPGGATAKTDAAGAFSLAGLDLGVYTLTFHLAGYLDQTLDVPVSLAGPSTVSVSLAVDVSATPPPAVAVSDQLTAGYGAPITLTATATGAGALTYAWTQTSGPTVTLSGDTSATLSFTTQDLPTSLGPVTLANARFGVLGLSPDKAGNYAFQLTVTDAGGRKTQVTAHVNAARTTSGLGMVPTGIPVWLAGNATLIPLATGPQTTWNWTIDASGAPGSAVTAVDNPTSQFPSFTPDVAGVYLVSETVQAASATPIRINAGPWLGAMTQTEQDTCMLCHGTALVPNAVENFTPWKGTKHYSALQRKIEGEDGQGFSQADLARYTVGYDKTAANNGFDDVQTSSGWQFPATLQAGNWSTLLATPALGQLAGIQCESCHGPQVLVGVNAHEKWTTPNLGPRVSWSSEVCAKCHQEAPDEYKAQQWELGAHADRVLALNEGSVEKNPNNAQHCGRCHSAQGFSRYAKQLKAGYMGFLTSDSKPLDTAVPPSNHTATVAEMTGFGMTVANVESQTCQACHNPHDASNPAQLRLWDSVTALPNGLTNVSAMGTGMICAACHNSRNGEHTDFASTVPTTNGIPTGVTTFTSFSGPHAAAQTDAVFGFNAYFVNRLNPSPHLAVENTCAGCHYKAVTATEVAAKQTSNHSFLVDGTVCANCHSASVDGKGLQAGYKMELDSLRAYWASKLTAPIAAAVNYASGVPAMVVTARGFDPVTGLYSTKSSSTSNITLTQAPTAVDYTSLGSKVYGGAAVVGLTLHLPTAVTFQPVDSTGANVGAPVTTQLLIVAPSSLKTNQPIVPATTPATFYSVFSAGTLTATPPPWQTTASIQVLYKAYWNMVMLNNDNTFGIHNPGFYDAVLSATNNQLKLLP